MENVTRARAIVKAAAASVRDPNTKNWLADDMYGTWEREALALLAKVPELRAKRGLTESAFPDSAVDSEISHVLGIKALTAQYAYLSGKPTKRRTHK